MKWIFGLVLLALVPLSTAWDLNPDLDDTDTDVASDFYRSSALDDDTDTGASGLKTEDQDALEDAKEDGMGDDGMGGNGNDDAELDLGDVDSSLEQDEKELDKMLADEQKYLAGSLEEGMWESSGEESDEFGSAESEFPEDSSGEPVAKPKTSKYFSDDRSSAQDQEDDEEKMRKATLDMDGFLVPGELPQDLGSDEQADEQADEEADEQAEPNSSEEQAKGSSCADGSTEDGKPKKCKPSDQMAEEDASDGNMMDDVDLSKFEEEYGSYLNDLQTESSLYEKKKVNLDHLYNHDDGGGPTVTESKKAEKASDSDILDDDEPRPASAKHDEL